jgi:hypothetical protein
MTFGIYFITGRKLTQLIIHHRQIDAVSEVGTIIEIKTAGKTPAQIDIDTNLQLTLYSYAYRMLYG